MGKYSVLYNKLLVILLPTIVFFYQAKAQKPLKFASQSAVAPTVTANNYYNVTKDKTSIISTIKAFDKDGVYDTKSTNIGYTLKLENKLKEEQFGDIVMQISNNTGTVLYKEVYPFKIKKRGVFEKDYVFAQGQLQPGFYVSSMSISTNRYADTIGYSFGYEPSKIVSKIAAPSDFVNFWDAAKRELAGIPANYTLTPRTDLAKKDFDAYEVEYKSIAKATIYGWLTVPKTSRNKPVLYKISDYMGELAPEFRRDVAVLSLNLRGTGSSTENYNFAYDQLGVYNLKDKNKYIFKGMYMDALRGLDFITQFAGSLKLDTRKVLACGSGFGASAAAVIAAIDSRLSGIILEGPSFIGMRDMINFGEGMTSISFPASMFKNYYTSQKVTKESVIKTLEYFDPIYFAPYISCPVLTGFSLHNTSVPAQCIYSFLAGLRVAKKDKYECKDCGNSLDNGFYGFKETWIKERFGQP
jgi:cephalosporin-C deacetylase-like acetyl esterase